jgi:predicted ATPase
LNTRKHAGSLPRIPLLLFRALNVLLQANFAAFNADLVREGAARLIALAEKLRGKVPLMVGHTTMGSVLLWTGNFAEAVVHLDQAIALEHDPVEDRRRGYYSSSRVIALQCRSLALWALGYPEAAFASAEQALDVARGMRAAVLMPALPFTGLTQLISGDYAIAKAVIDELIVLAEEKGTMFWNAVGMLRRASLSALASKPSDAVSMFTSVIPVYRSLGMRMHLPLYFSLLARACGELGQFEEARSYIGEAMAAIETTRETWYEAEVHRIAGEIALMSPERDAAKAEACFERALAVARQQQAKSWELRAALSMARLWREQGKRDEARELLAPVYGWFTEGFDTRDLKQAKAPLDGLAA